MPIIVVFLIGLGAFGLGMWLFKALVAQAPDEVELKRIEVSPRDEVEALVFAFERLGYVKVGTFSSGEQPGLTIHGLTHPSGRDGAVHDSDKAGVFAEVVLWSGEESTVITSLRELGLPQPPWKTMVHLEGASIEELHAASLEHEPTPLDVVEPHLFAGRVMSDYARTTAWLKANA